MISACFFQGLQAFNPCIDHANDLAISVCWQYTIPGRGLRFTSAFLHYLNFYLIFAQVFRGTDYLIQRTFT